MKNTMVKAIKLLTVVGSGVVVVNLCYYAGVAAALAGLKIAGDATAEGTITELNESKKFVNKLVGFTAKILVKRNVNDAS